MQIAVVHSFLLRMLRSWVQAWAGVQQAAMQDRACASTGQQRAGVPFTAMRSRTHAAAQPCWLRKPAAAVWLQACCCCRSSQGDCS